MNKRLRTLSNFLQFYVKQDEIQENDNTKWAGNKKQTKRNVLASLQSPDVDLLLDLLAEKHGVENAINILGNSSTIEMYFINITCKIKSQYFSYP